jgi:hypothetical protein
MNKINNNIDIDTETGEWKTGTAVVVIPKDNLENPDNFFYAVFNFLTGTSRSCQYTTEPIVVEFDNIEEQNNNNIITNKINKKRVSLQDFHSEHYFTNDFLVEFEYETYNVYNFFPSNIRIKRTLDNVNIFNLACINLYEKMFLGINRIDFDTDSKLYECFFKLFDLHTLKLVFLIDKLSYGETTVTYRFLYNSSILDEVTILVILKKIMIKYSSY